ncbi:acetate--CoA ligase family protein [Maridesulfovibrio hydrothermalis]|uniref:CoA-binding domain-containing protein n=1 Tax=Maridesulfovibrio hydrothermalis AM13 = DSM 14728 TaxID=1121451 RepID=L0RFW8_9BACT|nr:acetate--CoA ligase family protein [Maridesulfovibrio hydrothermalis]CCO25132.1 CoA-binding domain-containing protein [Maridesulfovibrio hydrothermalis AM13 = DSM 14728]
MFIDSAINFDKIIQLFSSANNEGRDFLFEYEVYNLLANSGAETPPISNLLPRGARLSDEELLSIPGEKTVLKIVSPTIIHKTEVGGVRIVKKEARKIRSAVRSMMYEVPENYASYIERHPDHAPQEYEGLRGEALIKAISRDLKGVLQVQFMPPDSNSFGNELIVGLRRTREFGTVISAGLGGTDTELYARRFRKGQAIVAASIEQVDGHEFFQLFKATISYKKLAGLTRGQRRIVTDEQLIECFDSFIEMGKHFSPSNPDASFIIEELEINPFAFTEYLMVPLDGLCRFSLPESIPAPRPVKKIHNLLHPEYIGIIGVSSTRRNFGRIILENILAAGFDKSKVIIIRDGIEELDGVRCVPDLDALDIKLDLFVVAIAATHVPDLVNNIVRLDCAESVMLIPGGMGETEDSKERAEEVIACINEKHGDGDGGPVFLGANCMGVVSHPGGYDTWFIPEEKLPKNNNLNFQKAALVSQSGAFMLHRSSQCPELSPAYMISMGNQTDLTLGDMVHYFKNSDEVNVIAVYAEGFNDLDGLEFCKAVREAVLNGKEVVFYKAGRTPEGKTATSGHTASLAGDYMVCESCVQQAGAIIARTFQEFQDLFMLAEKLSGKSIAGNRLAAVSGAGFEAVGMADSIQSDDYDMELAAFTEEATSAIRDILQTRKLESLVTIQNPLDITPGADDVIHAQVVEKLLEDPLVDSIVIGLDPLSPVMHTLAEPTLPAFSIEDKNSIAALLIKITAKSKKPVLGVIDGGKLYDPLRDMLMKNNVPVLPVCDRAVAAIALYSKARLHAEIIRITCSGI